VVKCILKINLILAKMAIIVRVTNAKAFLEKVIVHIISGKSSTWNVNPFTKAITHSPAQWLGQAYLVGSVDPDNDIVRFRFEMGTPNPEYPKTRDELYPYFHGRFVSFLFNHFHREFNRVIATSDTTPEVQPPTASKTMKLPNKPK
jgi:hypothetical protein